MIGDAFFYLKEYNELGLVIGAITESQQLIDHALQSEQKGGQINMCTALEDLKKEGITAGIQEGEVKGTIKTCKKFNYLLIIGILRHLKSKECQHIYQCFIPVIPVMDAVAFYILVFQMCFFIQKFFHLKILSSESVF